MDRTCRIRRQYDPPASGLNAGIPNVNSILRPIYDLGFRWQLSRPIPPLPVCHEHICAQYLRCDGIGWPSRRFCRQAPKLLLSVSPHDPTATDCRRRCLSSLSRRREHDRHTFRPFRRTLGQWLAGIAIGDQHCNIVFGSGALFRFRNAPHLRISAMHDRSHCRLCFCRRLSSKRPERILDPTYVSANVRNDLDCEVAASSGSGKNEVVGCPVFRIQLRQPN